jgi:hypothetical protein
VGVTFNVAVIMLRNRSTAAPPAVTDVRRYLLDDRFSIARFWQDATYGWVSFPRMDFLGWFDVDLPDGTSRSDVVEAGKRSARRNGVDLSAYDTFLTVVSGAGLDSGAYGRRAASVNAADPHHFVAHEIGHAIGFDHTYGIPNAGSDWNGDDVVDLNPVYGDPYCIMSGMTFGGAAPTIDLASKYQLPALAGLPSAWRSGPLPSRACLHFQMPLAAETAGKVRHIREAAGEEATAVNVTGGGIAGPEVAVFHPVGEQSNGIGRVYAEYRWPDEARDGTRWDGGLATTGDPRDRAGIVIHVINPEPSSGAPVVWYVGRIVLPTADLDVTVPTPVGPVTVSIGETDVLGTGHPSRVVVRFRRVATRSVHLVVNSSESRVVTATEMRTHPAWPLHGTFAWERREVTRTTRYRPFVLGLGGAGPFEGPSPVQIAWSLGGVPLATSAGTATVSVPGGSVHVRFAIDATSNELTLSNRPADGAYSLAVECTATASTDAGLVSAAATFSAPAVEEGWGDDYYRFLDWWHDLTNPVPIELLPPRWWLERRIERATAEIDAVARINPTLADSMKVVTAEVARAVARV